MVDMIRPTRILCIACSRTQPTMNDYDHRRTLASQARTGSVLLCEDMPPGAPYRLVLDCQGYKDGFRFRIECIPSRSGSVLAKVKCNVKFDPALRSVKVY